MSGPVKFHHPCARLLGAAALAAASLLGGAVHADTVLMGSDYFKTAPGSFFTGPGPGFPNIPVNGLPINAMGYDTVVHRQGDCSLDLSMIDSCTIPIEVVALQLIGVDPSLHLRVRELAGSVAGSSRSGGSMTMTSDGSGNGGTFTSFFDVFFELSLDDGLTFQSMQKKQFTSSGSKWTTVANGLLIGGAVGDQDANQHSPKGAGQFDFFLDGLAFHDAGDASHVTQLVPEPNSLALLGLSLVALLGVGRRSGLRAGPL